MSAVNRLRTTAEILTRLKSPDPQALASSYDAQARTVEAVVATEAPIPRFGVFERLEMSRDAANLRRADGGRMAFLLNHDPNRPIGTVVKVSIKQGQLIARLRFADTPEGRKAEGQVARGELSQFSIGFSVHDWSAPTANSNAVRATAWELYEVSLVSIPADPAAVVRSLKGPHNMDPEDEVTTIETPPAPPSPAQAALHTRGERQRVQEIMSIAQRSGLDQATIDAAIGDGTTAADFRARAFDHLVNRAGNQPLAHRIVVGSDEGDVRVRDMAQELQRRMSGESRPRTASSQRFFDVPLIEMAAEAIGHRGRIPTSAVQREQILKRAFQTTSDFPSMLENAKNGRLQERYQAARPSYRQLCWRRDLPDFRPSPLYRGGDFPPLGEVPEGCQISFGTFSDKNREVLTILSYAKILAFSRQLLVNDQWGVIDDVLGSYATSVMAFEENMFWKLVLSASGAGPTLQSTTRPIFNTTDGSLAGVGAALSTTSVGAGRAAMRKHKTLDGLYIQSEPRFLVVGPDQETSADQLLASIVPNEIGKANPFAGKLDKVVSPEISGDDWYLFADPARVPAFAYSLLEGADAPRLSFDDPFTSQGLLAKVEHDVGFTAIDFRGAYRNPGPT